jgi:hypothetical protein
MLMDRIIGAFTFRREVYAEVEKDTTFTTTAWILVIVIAFLQQLGANASANLVSWVGGAVVGTIVAVIGFAVAALVIQWLGHALFKADVTFEEMVRTLGLAYVWNVVGVIAAVAGIIPGLNCLMLPVVFVAAILALIAWFVAAKEALDLDWVPTIVTVIIGWIVLVVITFVVGAVVGGILGLGGAAVRGVLPG